MLTIVMLKQQKEQLQKNRIEKKYKYFVTFENFSATYEYFNAPLLNKKYWYYKIYIYIYICTSTYNLTWPKLLINSVFLLDSKG